MNRREKNNLIYDCYKTGVTDPQTIYEMGRGWGDWTVAHVEIQLNRIRQRGTTDSSSPANPARSANPIERINATPMDSLRFRDLVRLKVGGRDEFSALRGKQLESRVDQNTLAAIQQALPHDRKSQHSAIRWVLRGLEVTRAIRKANTDLEVAQNADYAREKKAFWESPGAEDYALDAMKEGEDLEDIIHPEPETEIEIAGFTVIRSAPNLATIVSSDGEVLAEKDINNDKHWRHFLRKFRESEEYRKECTQRR